MYYKLTAYIDKFYKLAFLDEDLYEFLSEVLSLLSDEDIKRFGNKIYLSSLFDVINKYRVSEDKITWKEFANNLLKLHFDDKIKLARADLITAMDVDLIERSEIPYETETFHFLDTDF